MLRVDNIEVFNMEGALRGMRNPLESWDKGDSFLPVPPIELIVWGDALATSGERKTTLVGPVDMKLAQNLIKAGPDHSKFMRQILVSMDIDAPLYWWKEMDTYKVGTTANSESTMHRLSKTPITKECFSFDDGLDELMDKDGAEQYYVDEYGSYMFFSHIMIEMCEQLRKKFVETGDKRYWRALIQLLPSSWNQMRTWTANYSVLRNIYFARKSHKLTEWHDFCKLMEKLPYGKELITLE